MRDREIVGLHQAYLDVYSNLNYNQDIVEVAEYLVAEGYADSYEEAEYIIEDMSDEEFEELCEKKLAHSFPLKPKDRRSAENIGRMNAGDFSVPPEEENVRVRSARKVKPEPEPEPAPSKTRSSRRRIEFDDRSGSSDQGRRGRRKLNAGMEYDTFDAILEHLVAEGYADTNESALAIMANMSEGWRESILDEEKKELPQTKMYRKAGELARSGIATGDEGKKKRSAKIVSAITRETERKRFDEIGKSPKHN
jgi:hypothetical protein